MQVEGLVQPEALLDQRRQQASVVRAWADESEVRNAVAQLPELIRWQAEILLADDLHRIAGAVDRISHVVERVPEVVAQ